MRIALSIILLLAPRVLSAAEPCDTFVVAPVPAPERPPVVEVWSGSALHDAAAGPCATLGLDSAKLVVGLRASFRFAGWRDDLLRRIGAISSLAGTRYWSVTEKAWRPFITDAQALAGPDPDRRRGDFAAAELRRGEPVYYVQRDNRASRAVVYRMTVTVSREHIIVDSENVSPLPFYLITLFPAGTLHTHLRLDRRPGGVWEAVAIDWVNAGASALALGHDESFVNRSAALLRHLAGVPGDQEPPLAP